MLDDAIVIITTLALYSPPSSLLHLPWYEAHTVGCAPLGCGHFLALVEMAPREDLGCGPLCSGDLCVLKLQRGWATALP